MMSARWSDHFCKLLKTDWWYYSIQMFYLGSIFLWFWSFFFYNDCWTVHQHQIRCAKNVTQISRKWSRKKFINQKSCFVFKKCCQFFVNVFLHVFNQREYFQQFIQNMIFDFDSFDETSQFFFIRGIRINRFLKFQNLCFAYDLLFAVVCVKISFSIFFILWIDEHLAQFFHFFNRLTAFIVSIKIELIMCSLSRHHFFHRPLQSFLQRQRESIDFSDVL